MRVRIKTPILRGYKEIAAYLKVGVDTCRKMVREQSLPVILTGSGQVCASRSAIHAWILKNSTKGSDNIEIENESLLTKDIPINSKVICLLSGGLDSSTALALADARNNEIYALSVDYQQRHRNAELKKAIEFAKIMRVKEHKIVPLKFLSKLLTESALTNLEMQVPKNRSIDLSIPITYVPSRNLILLSLAAGWAENMGVRYVVIGANILDYSGYPDCRPEFLASFIKTANLASKRVATKGTTSYRLFLCAPLIEMSKAEIIKAGLSVGMKYQYTWSCYDPVNEPDGKYKPCGKCDSCILRIKGFKQVGLADPLLSKLEKKRGNKFGGTTETLETGD